MSPTGRAALLLAAVAAAALWLPATVTLAAAAVVLGLTVVDGLLARRVPRLTRTLPHAAPRGRAVAFGVDATGGGRGRLHLRQPVPPGVQVEPATGRGRIAGSVVARRRGRHELPAIAARHEGPLGLGASTFRGAGSNELLVYPDLPAARRLARAVREGKLRAEGRHRRGPLGLGTELESVRDYRPDDDLRQVNWAATARVGRFLANQYRVEQDRDVVCLVDAGRLMAAPVGDRSRLDAAVDAAVAVAAVADELGDRAGCITFDDAIRRDVPPRRRGATAVVTALFDVEPRLVDADYGRAFRRIGRGKRALVVVFTDLVDLDAGHALLDALPVLVRRHAVVVASPRDPDLEAAVDRAPTQPLDVYRAAVAVELLDARSVLAHRLRGIGAEVVEAPAPALGEACVRAYLRLKARARV